MRTYHLGLILTAVVTSVVSRFLNITISTPGEIASDKLALYYPSGGDLGGLLVGNDGAATGGFSIWTIPTNPMNLSEPQVFKTGRTKLVSILYGVAETDWIVTLSQSDSYLRLFDLDTREELESAKIKIPGDYSAVCQWRATNGSGSLYVYIFGKKQAKMFLFRGNDDNVEILEVSTFPVPIEAEGCTVSQYSNVVLFAGDDGNIYSFPAVESTSLPKIKVLLSGSEEIKGLTTYYGTKSEYLVIIYEDVINVFDAQYELVSKLELEGLDDYELADGAFIQSSIGQNFPQGAIGFAIESDDVTGFAISSIEGAFPDINVAFSPRDFVCKNCSSMSCEALADCSNSGYCPSSDSGVCQCFSGFSGETCSDVVCEDNCSGNGSCDGPNICTCKEGWAGSSCSLQLAYPKYETEENGADGDDPAIWISPQGANLSRVITTTKSRQGAGFALFDLQGRKLQTLPASEPNNVDIIYGFNLGNRTVDLIYAACRGDNTLCFAELTSNGTLVDIPGGSFPTPEDYEVYGSCAYHSPISGKYYVFVNAKDATYLQYELSTQGNSTLTTTLVRSFRGGTGGQVEGCVVDDENGWLILGEEPYGLWRYSAEPPEDLEEAYEDKSAVGYLIDSIDGNMWADVEGVTLVYGNSSSSGLILVSCQGRSAYNIYRRAPPHEFVKHFQISTSKDDKVDGVTNTDGIAAVGTRLNADFPLGLIVVHDDVNEGPDGSVNEEAAFKLVSLVDVLTEELINEVDAEWNPRQKASD